MLIAEWSITNPDRRVERFLKRPAFAPDAEVAAAEVLAAVRARGDAAVIAYARRFDGARLTAAGLRVTPAEIAAATAAVDPAFRRAVREARKRIAAFAQAGRARDWRMKSPGGGMLGERFVPFERVGVYVPGGAAPLASTALMTATLAAVAGVPEIVVCSPCGADGSLNPFLLHAVAAAGATEIYRVGGVQSIGMMAFGTRTVPKVQKIVGPGGTFVTAAKRQVYGHVALDLVAGPSEIAVLADASADPRFVAADLLSQAEHGTGWEKALLVTPAPELAAAVAAELDRQTRTLSRAKAIRRVLRAGVLLAVVPSLDDGVELVNRFAPEHLEVMTRAPRRLLPRLRCAGAIFLGPWTPESAGDFAAGPSHVLPTGGAAAMFSGLTVSDFQRRSSVIAFTRRDLEETLPIIEAFGRVEGLDGHARSARIRFEREAT